MPCRVAMLHPHAPFLARSIPSPTHYQLTEARRLRDRRRSVNVIYPHLLKALTVVLHGNVTKTSIGQLADNIAASKQLKIDRLSRRTKEGLICWLCQQAPEIIHEGAPPNAGAPQPAEPSAPPEDKTPQFDWSQIRSDPTLIQEEEDMLRDLGFSLG
jgi:hypothetical protein